MNVEKAIESIVSNLADLKQPSRSDGEAGQDGSADSWAAGSGEDWHAHFGKDSGKREADRAVRLR